jgi:hypothetical protein
VKRPAKPPVDTTAPVVTVGINDRTVIISFNKPVRWIGMDKLAATELAHMLLKHAGTINEPDKRH